MGKTPKSPAHSEAVALHVELVQYLARDGVTWGVEVQRPGREGFFLRNWKNSAGQLDAHQAEDLCGWVHNTFRNALVVWGGIQGVLEE